MKEILKKYFIPHEENNYHPHILHTKRAVFYGGLFITMKIIVVGFVILLPSQVFMLPDVLKQQQDEIIALTNEVRTLHGKPVLFTQAKLTDSSQLKADDMATLSYFEHVGPNGHNLKYFLKKAGYDYSVAGENLGMGYSNARELVDAWVNSPTHYANLVDTDYGEFGVGLESGMYNGVPTVYVAQHFGQPRVIETIGVQDTEKIPVVSPITVQPQPVVTVTTEQSVLSETVSSSDSVILAYDKNASRVFWQEKNGKTELSVKGFIMGNVSSAQVQVNEYKIELFPTEEQNVYTGAIEIFKPADELFRVILMPTIHIIGVNNEMIDDAIAWNNVKIISPTPMEKYTHAKSYLGTITNIFDISRVLYLGFIIFFSLALLLKIIIQIRKQQYHIIGQTLALIGLLIICFKI